MLKRSSISSSARDCGPLAIPINGSLSGDLTTFPNKIVFSCDDGFNLVGSKFRRCLANGNWSGQHTFCGGSEKIKMGLLNQHSCSDSNTYSFSVLVVLCIAKV